MQLQVSSVRPRSRPWMQSSSPLHQRRCLPPVCSSSSRDQQPEASWEALTLAKRYRSNPRSPCPVLGLTDLSSPGCVWVCYSSLDTHLAVVPRLLHSGPSSRCLSPLAVPSRRTPHLAGFSSPLSLPQCAGPLNTKPSVCDPRGLRLAVIEEDYRLAATLRDRVADLTGALPPRKRLLASMLDNLQQPEVEVQAGALRVIGKS